MKQAPGGSATGKVGNVANDVQAIKALPEPLHSLITGAFSASLHDVFLSAVPLVAIALVVAFFLKEKPLATRDTPTAGTDAPEAEVVVAH
jgi:hypothetical protein